MKSIVKKLKSRAGFTLVELVVVIAVLAILAGVGSVAYKGYIDRANEAKEMEYLSAVRTAVDAALAKSGATVTKIAITSGKNSTPTVTIGSADTTTFTGVVSDYNNFMAGNADFELKNNWEWTSSSNQWTKTP